MPAFEFLRLSLSVPTIGDLDKDYDSQESDMNRKKFLTEAFSKRHDFFYRKNKYTYVPLQIENSRKNTFAGFIGKPVEKYVNAGPDQLFAPTKSKHYKAAFLAIDVAKDQQVITFEKRGDVGEAHGIIKTMLDSYAKEHRGGAWHSEVEYISLKEEFWRAAKEYQGQITELSFEFHPPNGLKAEKALAELNKMAKDQVNSQATTVSFKNKDGGINPEGDFVETAVKYTSEGAGKIRMKDGRKAVFSSEKKRKTKNVSKSMIPGHSNDDKSKILELFELLFGKKDG